MIEGHMSKDSYRELEKVSDTVFERGTEYYVIYNKSLDGTHWIERKKQYDTEEEQIQEAERLFNTPREWWGGSRDIEIRKHGIICNDGIVIRAEKVIWRRSD